MGDFDFNIPDFNLGGGETSGPAFPPDLNLGGGEGPSGPAFPPDLNLGGGGGGFDSGGLPNLPDAPDKSGFNFGDLARGVQKGAGALTRPLGLATAGMGLAAGIRGAKTNAGNQKIQREALDIQRQVAANQQAAAMPLTQFGQDQLKLAQSGNVPPAIQAQIDQLVAGYKQKINDFAARSGQGDSSMIREWLQWADQQGLALKGEWIRSQQQTGIQALQGGASAFGGAGQTAGNIQTNATNQSTQITALMDQANKALASLTAGAS